jgi:exosortase
VAILVVWLAGFLLCYGGQSFKAALFPWCFLLLIIPLPAAVLDNIVVALQKGSAEVSFVLFKAAGIPIVRQGLTFSLPGIDIEIGKACSGIRSGVSLFIVSILASHLFLHSTWRKVCLCLFTVPVVIFKNAVRIVGISWLGLHVTRDFFQGRLHHQYGGLVFSLLSLAIQISLLFLLSHSEAGRIRNASLKQGVS